MTAQELTDATRDAHWILEEMRALGLDYGNIIFRQYLKLILT